MKFKNSLLFFFWGSLLLMAPSCVIDVPINGKVVDVVRIVDINDIPGVFDSTTYTMTKDKYLEILNSQPDEEVTVLHAVNGYEREITFPTILTLPDRYVMYYVSPNGLLKNDNLSFSTCYAISKDGLNWYKPDLGIVNYNGSTRNNIISNEFEGVSVTYNNGSFYLLSYITYEPIALYKSSDGKNFEKVQTFSIPYCCDTQNQIMWDNKNSQYKLYMRSWYDPKNKVNNHSDNLYRSVSFLENMNPEQISVPLSPNAFYGRWGKNNPPCLTTELPVVLKNKTTEIYDLYNPCVHKYGDSLYVAYPTVFHHTPDPLKGGSLYGDGYGNIGAFISDNGTDFEQQSLNYVDGNGKWIEMSIGHIETKDKLIHYYVRFDKTHGQQFQTKNEVIARVHYKK